MLDFAKTRDTFTSRDAAAATDIDFRSVSQVTGALTREGVLACERTGNTVTYWLAKPG